MLVRVYLFLKLGLFFLLRREFIVHQIHPPTLDKIIYLSVWAAWDRSVKIIFFKIFTKLFGCTYVENCQVTGTGTGDRDGDRDMDRNGDGK